MTLLLGTTFAANPEALGEARSLLEQGQAARAVVCLEDALAATPRDLQGAYIELLRQAYAAAAKEAEARGRSGEAESYRDNLEILGRKGPASPPSPATAAHPELPSEAPVPERLPPQRGPSPAPRSVSLSPPAPTPITAAPLPPMGTGRCSGPGPPDCHGYRGCRRGLPRSALLW